MARKTRKVVEDDVESSPYETSAASPVEVVPADDLPPMVDPTPSRGSAVAREATPEVEVEVRRYRVMQTARFMVRGNLTLLRAGKVVDERQYDIDALLSQGAQLVEA